MHLQDPRSCVEHMALGTRDTIEPQSIMMQRIKDLMCSMPRHGVFVLEPFASVMGAISALGSTGYLVKNMGGTIPKCSFAKTDKEKAI